MAHPRQHLLGIETLPREEIESILDSATSMKEVLRRDIKKVPALRGKTVVNCFFENSTRTRTSFEIAAKIRRRGQLERLRLFGEQGRDADRHRP